ncbi:MAG: M15 family metallopeptidase [Polyangiales bacterium]
MTTLRNFLAFAAIASYALTGCAVAHGGDGEDGVEEETEPQEDGREAEGATVGVDCSARHTATGYKSGSPFTITVVHADGKDIEVATASMYARMQHDAAKAGIGIRIVSGFRTMEKQKELYQAYLNGTGNLAAKPGYSNHQSGHALDLNTSAPGVYSWLAAHAASYGFKRTVPSEAWHWEYWGGAVDGTCSSTASPTPSGSGSGCYSSTLGKEVVVNTCVQSRADRKWYQCLGGNNWEIRWNVPAKCVSEHPL